jgi:hypothetical protein
MIRRTSYSFQIILSDHGYNVKTFTESKEAIKYEDNEHEYQSLFVSASDAAGDN